MDLNHFFFTLGGAESNENAIKMARMYTGRHKILARYRSYHGATMGAITLTGDPRRPPVEPGIPGVVHVLDPYCYRCPFALAYPQCGIQCAKHVEEVIQYEVPGTVAAIIMESICGSNGIFIQPPEYLPMIREICDKYGILMICDEVMTGFGRTGKWFGVDHWNVVPDMITMAKGLTSSYVPLGAVAVTKENLRLLPGSHALGRPDVQRPSPGLRRGRGSGERVQGRKNHRELRRTWAGC